MKSAAMILFAFAASLLVFAWWGTSTAAGKRRYDEMDGIYPFAAGALGVILFVVAFGIVGWFWRPASH